MASTTTLTDLSARVAQFLLDTGNARIPALAVTEGIRLALGEYSRALPLECIGTMTPAAGSREVSLATLTGLVGVARVAFPYVAGDSPLKIVPFDFFENGGTYTLFLKSDAAPDGAQVARVFYRAMHTLNGLDTATATTYPATADTLLVLGAAGHCCFMRSLGLSETADQQTTATPNLAVVGSRLLREFRFRLGQV